MANYPINQQAPQGQPMQPMQPMQPQGAITPMNAPKSIREYVKMLGETRAQREAAGLVPTFTNVEGGQGHRIIEQGGGALRQQDPYESIPEDQRRGIDPYERVKMRMPSILPEIWKQMFPGIPPGGRLTEQQQEKWQGAVMTVSNKLLEKYDKEYGEAEKKKVGDADAADKNRQGAIQKWQEKYLDMQQRGGAMDETGRPISQEEFVKRQLAISEGLRDPQREGGRSGSGLTASDVKSIASDKKHSALYSEMQKRARELVSQGIDKDKAKAQILKEFEPKILKALGK